MVKSTAQLSGSESQLKDSALQHQGQQFRGQFLNGRLDRHQHSALQQGIQRARCSEGVGSDRNDEAGTGREDESSAGQGDCTGGGESRAELPLGSSQEPEGDLSEGEIFLQPLPEETALQLARTWHIQKNPFSKTWQALVWTKRPLLVELACFSDSRLSSEVERRFGKGAAIRLAEWNGADLETKAGVQLAMQKIRKLRPVHLWISTECGPFCPLQRLNRRTPEQCKNLQEKQDKVKLQYQGALRVAEQGWQVGTQVHWEWAQKSEAWSWSLDFFQDYEHQHSLKRVDCNGCTVELRTRDGKQALCKAWRVSTRY